MGNYFLIMLKFALLFAAVAAATVADESVTDLSTEFEGDSLWTYRQRVALRKWYKFYKWADTNHTGKLTWYEFWRGVYILLKRKGYSHAIIMRYKAYFYKVSRKVSRGDGLISWADIVRY